jgi:hypothetical protein
MAILPARLNDFPPVKPDPSLSQKAQEREKFMRKILFVSGAILGGIAVYSYFTPAKDNLLLKGLSFSTKQLQLFGSFAKKEAATNAHSLFSSLKSFSQTQLLPFGASIAQKASVQGKQLISLFHTYVTKENAGKILLAIGEKASNAALFSFQNILPLFTGVYLINFLTSRATLVNAKTILFAMKEKVSHVALFSFKAYAAILPFFGTSLRLLAKGLSYYFLWGILSGNFFTTTRPVFLSTYPWLFEPGISYPWFL